MLPAARTTIATCLLGFAGWAGAASLQPHEVCEALISPAGFDNRFAVLRAMTKLLACNLSGELPDERVELAMKQRLKLFSDNCFDDQEQAYLRSVFQRAVVQEMGRVKGERCEEALVQVEAMPLPDNESR